MNDRAFITQPGPQVRQLSGLDAQGNLILSVLVKLTYRIVARASCLRAPAEEQVALVEDPKDEPNNPQLLAYDTDLFPYKLATDVVVRGHAYAPQTCTEFEAGIAIGAVSKRMLVIGDRCCHLTAGGQIVISPPAALEQVPLRYDHAYGGHDLCAEARHGNPLEVLKPYLSAQVDIKQASPFRYPRNPCGRGYLVEATRTAIEQLLLPNFEDLADRLSGARLLVGSPGNWPLMPLPQGLGFVDHGWFPRVAYFGLVPLHTKVAYPIAEVTRGQAPANILMELVQAEKFNLRCASGASLGLQLPYLRGDEAIRLTGLDRQWAELAFRLPANPPVIFVDGREGKLINTHPVLQTVLIEPDEDRVSLVWRGAAPARRPYMPEELANMPLRVEW